MNEARPEFPAASIDVVVLTLKDGKLHAALTKRPADPFKGKRCLVGGIVRMAEDRDLDETVARVLKERTGLEDIYAEQLYTFGDAS